MAKKNSLNVVWILLISAILIVIVLCQTKSVDKYAPPRRQPPKKVAAPAAQTPGKPATGAANALESTTSLTFVDLPTKTDTVTVDIGPSGMALVALQSEGYNTSSGGFHYARVSFDVSGANTISADENELRGIKLNPANMQVGTTTLMTGLKPGSTTFKMKYAVYSTGKGIFNNRRINVIPL